MESKQCSKKDLGLFLIIDTLFILLLVVSFIFIFSGCFGSYENNSSSSEQNESSKNNIDNSIHGSEKTDVVCEGLIWKPFSDKDGNLVVLSLEGDVLNQWEDVSVFFKDVDGDTEELLVFSGLGEKGNQQVWRGKSPGSEYTGVVNVYVEGKTCTYTVNNPSVRTTL